MFTVILINDWKFGKCTISWIFLINEVKLIRVIVLPRLPNAFPPSRCLFRKLREINIYLYVNYLLSKFQTDIYIFFFVFRSFLSLHWSIRGPLSWLSCFESRYCKRYDRGGNWTEFWLVSRFIRFSRSLKNGLADCVCLEKFSLLYLLTYILSFLQKSPSVYF